MLGTAVIVFREVLEAALIITLMLAATRGMPGRRRWIALGLLAGISGALLLAGFAERINLAMAGTGQEILNAGILMMAVVMLAWHLIWMRRHAAQLTQQIRRVGASVMAGEQAATALALIVGLAVLREGSELVLFLYGIAASGSDTGSLLAGSLFGLTAGILLGAVLYFGLLRIPVQALFRVTGWLILLLAAGLAAQSIGYLVQANLLPALGYEIWDSSKLLSQKSLLGQFLHITLGYLDQPMGIQLLAYVLTLATILALSRVINAKPTLIPVQAVIAFPAILFVLSFNSDPAEASQKVYSPTVEKGEVEIELRTNHAFDRRSDMDGLEKSKLEIGYGVTEYWSTALFGEFEREPGDSRRHSATSWENIFQLTEQGQYWVDVGLYLEYEHPVDADEHDALETKLLLEKTAGRLVHTLNLVFAHELGSGASSATNFEYAWRTQYLLSKHLNPGFELYGEMGEIGHFPPSREQDRRLGPVIYGELSSTGAGKWLYELGYLFDTGTAAPTGTLKAIIEYEYHF